MPPFAKTMNNWIMLVIGFSTIQYLITTGNSQELSVRRPWIDINWFLHNITDSHIRGMELQNVLNKECRLNSAQVHGTDFLNEMMRDFKGALRNNICILRSLKRVIEREYNNWEAKPRNEINSDHLCCKSGDETNSDVLHCKSGDEVRNGCALLPPLESKDSDLVRAPFTPQGVINEFARRKSGMSVNYVALNDGSVYIHPRSTNSTVKNISSQYDPRLRYFYTQTKSPGSRELIIVVDRRNDTNTELLKEAVKKILETLRPTDKVALCLPYNNTCKKNVYSKAWSRQNHPLGNWSFSGEMFVASNKNIKNITTSFDVWLNTSDVNPIDIIYNYTTTLSSAHDLLKQDLSCHITKGSCCQKLVVVTSRSEYCKWNISEKIRRNVVFRTFGDSLTVKGEDCILNSSWDDSDLFCQSNSGFENPVVTMPYVDGFGNGYIISLCLPLTKNEEFLGVVCSDINFVNLEAKLNVEGINGAYVFMVNSLGYTLMHPLLPPSYTITEDRTNINIINLEQAALVGSILDSIIQQSIESQGENYGENGMSCNSVLGFEPNTVACRDIEGVEVKSVGRPGGSNIPGIVKLFNKTLQYCWAPINNTDLTIALVLPKENSKVYLPLCEGYNPKGLPEFKYYHQLNSAERNCQAEQGRNNGSMIFSPDCFLDVASYVQNETLYNTRVNDAFNDRRPPQEFMRKTLDGSVKLLRRANQLWNETVRENNRSEEWNRYMGTADGAFISFLGKCFPKAYDHRNTPWYHRAVPFQQIDFISMSNPYFSECENRTVVTISRTLYDQYENPVAVVAADFPFQDIIHDFRNHVPNCTSVICILVDNAGYVVFKSDWEYIDNDAEIVASHIIRIAPDIAWSMIGNYILQRRACHDYEENLTFYYWSFALKGKDTVYESPMYSVHKITHTSLFLIVRRMGATERDCNCDFDKKGTNLECHDTCASECECPCRAGENTIPCHEEDQDVHRYPVPACKPLAYRGIRKCSSP